MNVNDIVTLDNQHGSGLEQELLDALLAFGFVNVAVVTTKTLIMSFSYIIATRKDGTQESWSGEAATAEKAAAYARAAVISWILNQPIPAP